jgi:transposase
VHAEPVSAVVESMTGGRIVHDTLEAEGWSVEIADAQKVKGLAPLACKTDKIDSLVLATLSRRDLVPAIWLPDPEIREERARPLSPSPGQAQDGAREPRPLDPDELRARLPGHRPGRGRGQKALGAPRGPEPWRSNATASVWLIDELERHIDEINRRLREGHADHPYVPLLLGVPGIGWVLAFTIAAEIGEIERFSSPESFVGYTGLCPTVKQSGDSDRRGPLSKHGPRYLRWALIERTSHALRHPAYAERYQRNKKRLGKQRGARVAQIDIARRLAHAIWHMLTRNQKFAPRGATFRLAA